MKFLSSLDAHLILLSASLLAGVGATPLPLALGTDTADVSRALGSRQVRTPAPREPMNFNYVRDSRLVVTSGRSLSEDTDTEPNLTPRSSVVSRYSNNPMIRRGFFDESPLEARIFGKDEKPSEAGNPPGPLKQFLNKLRVGGKNQKSSGKAAGNPIQQLLGGKNTRPSLQAAGNPIHQLLQNHLELENQVVDPSDFDVRMLRLDLLFALTEENDFKDSDVTELKKHMETDYQEFKKKYNQDSVANTCINRVMYYQEVLDSKDKYHVVGAAPPQVLGNAKTYRLYLEGEIQKIEALHKNMITLSLLDRITLLGLKFNLLKEDGFPVDQTRDFATNLGNDLTIFHVRASEGDAKTKVIASVCEARGEYYKALLPKY